MKATSRENFTSTSQAFDYQKDAQGQLLRALVIRFSAMSARTIVRNHLNTRGKSPPAENDLRFHQTYPEPGVIRFYCGGNIKAWSDKVILPSQFRQGCASHRERAVLDRDTTLARGAARTFPSLQ
jgi:hypothetical protein